jgi:hypothetical protein
VAEFQTLEDRRLLSATLVVSNSLMVFNAVNGSSPSQVETLTLTDTGSTALTLGSSGVSFVTNPNNPGGTAQFSIPNKTSIPASIPAGGSFALQLEYTANTVGIQSAYLQLATNDSANPLQAVILNGIGTSGTNGANQPSLERILTAYDIPTEVGEAANATVYPTPVVLPTQEVVMPRMVKAGPGPVTIQVLASFTQTGYAESYTLGYYSPSNPTGSQTELFYTPGNEAQSTYVQPEGSTQFDPGSTDFGFYFVSNTKDSGVDRVGYSEDDLNTFDTTVPRKFRFFPLENADGSVVANAYVMTSTEYQAPAGYDFTNIVAIVRNIMPATNATTGAAVSTKQSNPLPGSNNMIFSTIGSQNTAAGGDVSHTTNTLTIENTGASTLTISSYTLSSSAWQLVSAPTFPLSIAPDTSVVLSIKFVATTVPSHPYNETNGTENTNGGGVYTGSLVLNTNDPYDPVVTQPLAGWYQSQSEDNAEPALQTIVNLLAGWSTDINPTPTPSLAENSTSTATYYGQEVVSANWAAADTSRQVTVFQLNGYHTEKDTTTLYWYPTGTTSYSSLMTQGQQDAQSVLPLSSSNTATSAVFSPTTTFGWHLTSPGLVEDSLDSKNGTKTGAGHHFRFYPVVTAAGSIVPNTYIMTMDYGSVPENFDFQDNTYIITNVRPVTTVAVSAPQTTAAPAAPTDVTAVNTSAGITVEWAPVANAGVLAGYNVDRSSSPTGTFTNISGLLPLSATTAYTDSSAPAGATSYYKVVAVNSSGVQSLGATVFAKTAAVVATGSISGTVFTDNNGDGIYEPGTDTPLSGWGVFIDTNGNGVFNASNDSRVFSNASGGFIFTDLAPGTYRIAEMTPAGYNRTVPVGSYYTVTVTAGAAITGENFGVSGYGSISGTMFNDLKGTAVQAANDPVLVGWGCFIDYGDNGVFGGSDVRALTNANGVYTFSNIPAGSYFLSQATPTGWLRESPSVTPYEITVTAGQTTTVNFAEAQAVVTGTVFNDANSNGTIDSGEAGYSGWGVFIDNNGTGVYNPVNDPRVFTNSSGGFVFTGLVSGNYIFQEMTPAGYTRTTPGSGGWNIFLNTGQYKSGVNFGYVYGAGAAEAAPADQVASAVPVIPASPKAKPAAATPTAPLLPLTASPFYDDLKKKRIV